MYRFDRWSARLGNAWTPRRAGQADIGKASVALEIDKPLEQL